MKKQIIYVLGIVLLLTGVPVERADAQIPIINIITAAIKKVITAIDLKVQQLQNKTIMLQNAEKELENKMALGNLNDISGWLDKERSLYKEYYDELAQVKKVIADYDLVKNIIRQQSQLVSEYKNAYHLFQQDKHFSADELSYMGRVYSGILDESVRNLDEVLLAVNALSTQMSDAQRLQLIHTAGGHMQHNLDNLRQFNSGNMQLSLQRTANQNEQNDVRQLYGLPKN